MDFKDYYDFCNENKTCYFRHGGDRSGRESGCLGMWFADETGFYFQAQSVKAMCKQMQQNQKVEVYFHTKDFQQGLCASTEKVQFIEDLALKAKCIQERPFGKTSVLTETE